MQSLTDREKELISFLLGAVDCGDVYCPLYHKGCNGSGLYNSKEQSDCAKLWDKLKTKEN